MKQLFMVGINTGSCFVQYEDRGFLQECVNATSSASSSPPSMPDATLSASAKAGCIIVPLKREGTLGVKNRSQYKKEAGNRPSMREPPGQDNRHTGPGEKGIKGGAASRKKRMRRIATSGVAKLGKCDCILSFLNSSSTIGVYTARVVG